MSKPIIDLGPNVVPLNERARTYHAALEASQADLYMLLCGDLWSEPKVLTGEAVAAFYDRFKGKHTFMVVPMDPIMAAEFTDMVLVATDIAEIEHKT